jgi:hypothetical protein
MDLRKRVDEILSKRRAELEKQLERMGVITSRVVGRGGGSGGALKGKRVPPKYRSPSVKPGQVAAQDLVGLLLPSRVERSSMIT